MEGGRGLAKQIPTRLSRDEGRKFGLQVGAAFLVLAALGWWRGKHLTAEWLGGIGALLIVGGLIAPSLLSPVFKVWMQLAHALSKVTTPIFMGVIYYLVLTPTGLLLRLVGRDPLRPRVVDGSLWSTRDAETAKPGRMERQF